MITNLTTVSPLHMNIQVANVQSDYAFECPVTWVGSCFWCTLLSHTCILYKWLCFVYFTIEYCIKPNNTISLFQACDMSEIAVSPPSPVNDNPSALLSPNSSPSSSLWLFLPVHWCLSLAVALCYCTFQYPVL